MFDAVTVPVAATLVGVMAPKLSVIAGVVVGLVTTPLMPFAGVTETAVTVPVPEIVSQDSTDPFVVRNLPALPVCVGSMN
jgi:hypothetical protein